MSFKNQQEGNNKSFCEASLFASSNGKSLFLPNQKKKEKKKKRKEEKCLGKDNLFFNMVSKLQKVEQSISFFHCLFQLYRALNICCWIFA